MTREEIIKELSEMRTDAWTDTRQMKALSMAIKALEQEPSGDLISREAVLDLFQDNVSTLHNYARVWEAVEEMPSVTPTERTGHWSHDGSHWKNRFICSECGYKLFDEPTNYCPNCGCRMFESQEGEEKE